jgi:hypothetical protein
VIVPPPLPAQENLHVALANVIPEATPSWSNKALIAAVERYVAAAQQVGLFALLDEEASA